MRRYIHLTSILLLLSACIGHTGVSFGATAPRPIGQDVSHCYGLAMVGMDSVINSRLGIYPEDMLHLAIIDPHAAITDPDELFSANPYSVRILKVIYEAYLWKGEPHEYAFQVLDSCIA